MIGRLVAATLLAALCCTPAVSSSAPTMALPKPLHAALDIDRSNPIEKGESGGIGPLGEVWHVPMDRKEIALTFDDGPYPFYTSLLLHELERSHVVGTFFLVGRSCQEFPQLVRDLVADGDEIGNHTFNHYTLTGLPAAEIARQISSDGELLEPFAGHPITLFRPPHGRFDHRVVAIAHAMGYETVFWSDSPEDTKNITPALLVQRVLARATPGGIVLLHNGQYKTIEALPVIIDRLRAAGFTFVTVTQLLRDGDS
jgi:peptidoglycan/xylan/chitin deacetylase (PgdA/CDA1 family)